MSVPCQKNEHLEMYLLQDHFISMSVWLQMDQDIERSSALWGHYGNLLGFYDNIMTMAVGHIPHICHFFTQAKFLESKIYTENRQFFTLNL